MGARIVIPTFGSFGDLHPYFAVAHELKRRGHEIVFATSEVYRSKVGREGFGFHAVRPDYPDFEKNPEAMTQLMEGLGGHEFFFSRLRESFEDTRAAARGADLILSHPISVTSSIVAELDGIPWVSSAIYPIMFFSVHDPPILVAASGLAFMRRLPLPLYRAYFRLVKWSIRHMGDRVRALRAEVGLGPGPDPLFEGVLSPTLVLAMFSSVLAQPQPDWPGHTTVCGYCFHDQDGSPGLSPELERFLESGPPPLVFTLGTSAVWKAGSFYVEAADAARIMGRRAILLVGRGTKNVPPTLPEGVIAADYAPFSKLFPRALAIIHQAGSGTTGEGLRSGRPVLLVPWAFDQPDNADRVARLGVGRVLAKAKFRAARVARELEALLGDSTLVARAAAVGEQVRAEDGPRTAADAIEALLARLAVGRR